MTLSPYAKLEADLRTEIDEHNRILMHRMRVVVQKHLNEMNKRNGESNEQDTDYRDLEKAGQLRFSLAGGSPGIMGG